MTLESVVTGPLGFVKLNIEGYEYRVLLGVQKLFDASPTRLAEVHPVEPIIFDVGANVGQTIDALRTVLSSPNHIDMPSRKVRAGGTITGLRRRIDRLRDEV